MRAPSRARSSRRAREAPIATTRALAEIVARVVHARPGAIHPATRTFQALRMFVNDELGELADGARRGRARAQARRPARGGRRSIRSKTASSRRSSPSAAGARGGSRHLPEACTPPPTFRVLTKRPVVADEAEIAANPRARSAKLRAAERTDAPARGGDLSDLLPRLPSLADVMRGRR